MVNMKRILVALDASPVSIHARQGGRLGCSAGVPDVEYLALNVAAVSMAMAGDPSGGGLRDTGRRLGGPREGGEDVTGVEERAHRPGSRRSSRWRTSATRSVGIVAVAEAHDVDLIVVGAHDKGFLRRLVDPSVSQGVLHHTRRPVLVVHEEHTPATPAPATGRGADRRHRRADGRRDTAAAPTP